MILTGEKNAAIFYHNVRNSSRTRFAWLEVPQQKSVVAPSMLVQLEINSRLSHGINTEAEHSAQV